MNPSKPVAASEAICAHRLDSRFRAVVLACIVASIAATTALAPNAAHAQGVRETHKNLVGGEILGRGIVGTFNYERFFNNHFGLGGGLMAIGSSAGVAGIMPLYASYLPGDIHSFYLGAGAAYVGGGGDLQDYESTWLMQVTAGYQFQSPNGFWVRPTFTLNVETMNSGGEMLIWPGIALGGSF